MKGREGEVAVEIEMAEGIMPESTVGRPFLLRFLLHCQTSISRNKAIEIDHLWQQNSRIWSQVVGVDKPYPGFQAAQAVVLRTEGYSRLSIDSKQSI